MDGIKFFGATLITVSLIFLILFGITIYNINYSYEKVIGSHMDNAYNQNTPEGMLKELRQARVNMVSEGLTNDMHGAVFYKKPTNSMEFQYNHIDSIISRVEAVQVWYDSTYTKGTNTETMGDVYEQKMDNLANFIYETQRSDWIAKDTWMIKNHKIYYFQGYIWALLVLLLIVGLFFCIYGGIK